VLGVTGGIASGKSTALRLLGELGVDVLSADELARQCVAPGSPTLAAIAALFGPSVLRPDGALDRRALGGRVFDSAAARAQLESVLHPAIAALAATKLRALWARGAPVVAYEVPLLGEKRLGYRFDQVVVVAVPAAVQRHRLRQRDGATDSQAARRLAAQLDNPPRLALADYVIDNTGTVEQTGGQVRALWRSLTRCR
jgi:dephospho-CoA kinase